MSKFTINNHAHEYEPSDIGPTCKHCGLLKTTIEALGEPKNPLAEVSELDNDSTEVDSSTILPQPASEPNMYPATLKDVTPVSGDGAKRSNHPDMQDVTKPSDPSCSRAHCKCMKGKYPDCPNHHYFDCKTGPYTPEPASEPSLPMSEFYMTHGYEEGDEPASEPKVSNSVGLESDELMEILVRFGNEWIDRVEAHAAIEALYAARFERALGENEPEIVAGSNMYTHMERNHLRAEARTRWGGDK